MDYKALQQLLFPNVTETYEDILAKYPKRQLKEGAKVTRIAPSPTGFMHLGNLFGAITDERLAHQSEGVFYLRIEDTDKKREVEGGVETILKAFSMFGLKFDEGATVDGETGAYGPYRQSQRAAIYAVFAKHLVGLGMAYPCFATEEELASMRKTQEENKENFGYYGKYAISRNLTLDEVKAKLDAKIPYVIRFKSEGNIENKIKMTDLVKGNLEVTENDQDVVILKSDGIPTYHFAHVVDDTLMGTTHVVRGEEWLATLPIHLQLFRALNFKAPKYVHTAQLMKMDGESKRKLSKRKDPELALDFYYEEGYPVPAVLEYLLTLLNSNFEEWRMANPTLPMESFPFNTKKMSASGSLFDINKLCDVSKNVISRMSAKEVYDYVAAYLKNTDENFYNLFTKQEDYTVSILNIGRGGKKPRKDIALWSDVKGYMDFFFDEIFTADYSQMPEIDKADILAVLKDYKEIYDATDDNSQWFEKLKPLAEKYGYAAETKAYKKEPQLYKGHVGDISMVIRVALAGRANCPDLYEVCNILGTDKIMNRLDKAILEIGE